MSNHDHQWNLSVPEAVLLQKKLAGKVIQENRLGWVERVAGADHPLWERPNVLFSRQVTGLIPLISLCNVV